MPQIALAQDRRHPEDWRVELWHTESEGEGYVAIFSGTGAQEAATDYYQYLIASQAKEVKCAH
jgi:hypothetical protein